MHDYVIAVDNFTDLQTPNAVAKGLRIVYRPAQHPDRAKLIVVNSLYCGPAMDIDDGRMTSLGSRSRIRLRFKSRPHHGVIIAFDAQQLLNQFTVAFRAAL